MPLSPTIEIEGIKISGDVYAHLIRSIVRPDPRVWFRFTRKEDPYGATIIIEQKIEE